MNLNESLAEKFCKVTDAQLRHRAETKSNNDDETHELRRRGYTWHWESKYDPVTMSFRDRLILRRKDAEPVSS